MIEIFKKATGMPKLVKQKKIGKGCWINVVDPDEDEINKLKGQLKIEDIEYLTDPLDPNETPRIEEDEGVILVIFRIPHIRQKTKFDTYPLGVILKDNIIITICKNKNEIIEDFKKGKIKNFYTSKRVRFLLQLFLRSSQYYMLYLKHIEKEIKRIEGRLSKTFKNEDLMMLTELEKSLLYFHTAVITNDNVMKKIVGGKILPLYHEDQELLEDILTENQQAIEMTSIYLNLITTLRDAYTSMISNNLNTVMKFLTAVTLIISIPTMIASFYGMNFKYIPFFDQPYGFVLVTLFSLILGGIIGIWMKNKGYL